MLARLHSTPDHTPYHGATFLLKLSIVVVGILANQDIIDELDDPLNNDLEAASFSVDALVADSTNDGPSTLGPFESYSSTPAGTPRGRSNTPGARIATPIIPPGFDISHANSQAPPSMKGVVRPPVSRIIPTSAPFTPTRNLGSATPAMNNATSPTSTESTPISTKQIETPITAKSQPKARTNIQSLAAETGLSKAISAQYSAPVAVLEDIDFPALQSDKTRQPASSNTAKSAINPKTTLPAPAPPAVKPVSKKNAMQASMKLATKPEDKAAEPSVRLASGKEISKSGATLVSTGSRSSTASVMAFPPLPSANPTSTAQNVTRAAPKTLRLVPTPKSEHPPTGSATPSSTTSVFPPMFPSARQSSMAFVSKHDRPGTPTSEIPSETASITSASMSRASSPPPSKIGSAPLRTTTKSMQKKQRKEAQKEREKTELDPSAVKEEAEIEIAPIIGRKKKQRKDKPAATTSTRASTPAMSRAPSPAPQSDTIVEDVVVKPVAHDMAAERLSIAKPKAEPLEEEIPIKEKYQAKVEQDLSPDPEQTTEPEHGITEKLLPTPATVFQELLDANAVPALADLQLLKPSVTRGGIEALTANPQQNSKLTVTSEDVATLSKGVPVHKIIDASYRVMLTPNGDCVRNLTVEEEARYLELQSSIANTLGPATFTCPKRNTTTGFTLISGRAVPNGLPPYFPTVDNFYNSAPDPFSKLNRDEALAYINQYVLPSLNTNPHIEHALNANAPINPSTLLGQAQSASSSNDPISSWASWTMHAQSQLSEESLAGYAQGATAAMALGIEDPGLYPGMGDLQTESEGTRQQAQALRPTVPVPVLASFESLTGGSSAPPSGWISPGDVIKENGEARERIQPVGAVPLLSLSEAEKAMAVARKETEGFEKRLAALLRKNRKLLLGSSS